MALSAIRFCPKQGHRIVRRVVLHNDRQPQATEAKLGFGGLGLPIIMEHNTPNNAVSLLWAESDGTQGHPMRPLFRRRQRHS